VLRDERAAALLEEARSVRHRHLRFFFLVRLWFCFENTLAFSFWSRMEKKDTRVLCDTSTSTTGL
jgi:hypothetical protein